MDIENTTMDWAVPLVSILIVVLAILVFAGYIIHEHEITIQQCIAKGMEWRQESCLK